MVRWIWTLFERALSQVHICWQEKTQNVFGQDLPVGSNLHSWPLRSGVLTRELPIRQLEIKPQSSLNKILSNVAPALVQRKDAFPGRAISLVRHRYSPWHQQSPDPPPSAPQEMHHVGVVVWCSLQWKDRYLADTAAWIFLMSPKQFSLSQTQSLQKCLLAVAKAVATSKA